MATRNPNWTEDELKMAINVYCKIPFIKADKTSPEIVRWAQVFGRSAGGLYTKICNLGHFDRDHQLSGPWSSSQLNKAS